MSRFRVTLVFDLALEDDEVIQRLAHGVVLRVAEEQERRGAPLPGSFATTPLEVADYASQDLQMAVGAGAVQILARGVEGLPGVEISRITSRHRPL